MKKSIIFTIVLFVATCCNAQGNLSLDQCLAMARQNNITLSNAALEIEAAGEQKSEAYTKYFPKISANVTVFQAFGKLLRNDGTLPAELAAIPQFASLAGQPFQIRELSRGYTATVTALQPIFAGGQITAGNRLAAIQQDAMKLQLQIKEKDVLQQVTQCFWQIVTVRYNLNTIDVADKQVKAMYNQVENFLKAGVTTRNDLLKVKLRQQELASDRVRLNNADLVLRMLLAQQIGTEVTSNRDSLVDIAIPELSSQLSALIPQLSTLDAANNREELALTAKNVEAQKQQLRMERGKLLPTVAAGVMGFQAGFGGMSALAKNYMPHNFTNGMVLGTVSIPISDWWGGSHAIKRQKLKIQEAQNTVEDTRKKLMLDIESARVAVDEAYEQTKIASTSVEQSEENLRMSTDQYNAGIETLTNLLDAETLHRKCKNNLSAAIATYQIKLADYLRKTR